MQGPLAARLGALAATLVTLAAASAAPLGAAEVFVPAINPVANDGSRSETELWISNGGEAPSFFDLEGPRTQVPARASKAVRVPGRAGDSLLTLELGSGVAATANLLTTAASGAVSAAPLPVFAPGDALPASVCLVLIRSRGSMMRYPEMWHWEERMTLESASTTIACTSRDAMKFSTATGSGSNPRTPSLGDEHHPASQRPPIY